MKEEIAAPIAEVWALLRNFGDIEIWAKARVVRVDGTGVGAIRHVEGSAGPVVERCEAHDEAAHSFSYSLVESPWPLANYVATVRLASLGANRCAIEWSANFDPTPGAPPDIRELVEKTFRGNFIANLRKGVAG
ncbi:SRPBCC family protein [Ramlibacter sp. PS4R-6]|uniref:SRPBCC family protein n=1 Tax=Ramlibacter sp. PS4R-6 TaxID=3133438 RepID=UPI0030A9C9A1